MNEKPLEILPDAKAAVGVGKYVDAVLAGDIIAGPSIRAVCQRHRDDLKKSKRKSYPYKFDAEKAGRMMNFFPVMLTLRSGKWDGRPFELFPWQQFMVGSLGGWVRKNDGRRRFQDVYLQCGKNNGKSPLCAGLALYLLIADNEPAAEVYLAAADYNQAGIVMGDILKAVENNVDLDSHLIVRGGDANPREITYKPDGQSMSVLRRIANNTTGKNISGFRPSAGVFDEVAFWKSPDMLDAMRRGGGKREQPLMLMLTNAGVGIESVAWPLYQHGIAVAHGETEDDTHFSLIFDIDKTDDIWNDESCWVKANPSYPTLPSPEALRKEIARCKSIPGERNAVRRMHFNEWVSDASQYFLGEEVIDAVMVEKLDDKKLADLSMVIGLDLSRRDDLTAAAQVWKDDDVYYIRSHFWVPHDGLIERSQQVPRLPWDVWAEQEIINAIEGKVVDYSDIVSFLMRMRDEWKMRGIAFDEWRSDMLFREFQQAGIDLHLADREGLHREPPAGKMVLWKHPQGFNRSNPSRKSGADIYDNGLKSPLWMSESIELLKSGIMESKVIIESNPCMRYNMLSVKVVENDSGGVRFTKSKSTGKIDGVVAAAMGVGLVNALPERSNTPRAMLVG